MARIGIDRQQPAGEEARLVAEVEVEQDRRGQQDQREPAVADGQPDRRRPARPATAASRTPRCPRPRSSASPRCAAGRACRPPRTRSRSAWSGPRGTRGRPAARTGRPPGTPTTASTPARISPRQRPAATAAATTATTRIPPVYLVAIASPSAIPASAKSRRRPLAVDAGHADQAERHRGERGRVVEREVAVVDGQEGHGEQRAGHQPDAPALEQPRPGERGEQHRGGAQHGRRRPGDHERRRRVRRERRPRRSPGPSPSGARNRRWTRYV